MGETIRIGDITGYDDAEVITLDEGLYLVIDNDTKEGLQNEDQQQNV